MAYSTLQHWGSRPPPRLPRPLCRCKLSLGVVFPHHRFRPSSALIGESNFTPGSISRDLTTHTHTWVGRFGAYRKLTMLFDRYLQKHQDITMFTRQPGGSQLDMVVRQCLNWPDGTRKKSLESQLDVRRDCKRQLVQALVDKYNDYHHLIGGFAYELKDVVFYKSVSGGNDRSRVYDHVNFTMKTKGADDSNCGIDDLFFAEVSFKRGESELVVSCFCMVKPTDNGHCYGCEVKHPNDPAAYTAGEVKLTACISYIWQYEMEVP